MGRRVLYHWHDPGSPPVLYIAVYIRQSQTLCSLSSSEVRLASFLRGRVQRAFGDLVLGCLPAWPLALSAEYPGRCASDGPHSFLWASGFLSWGLWSVLLSGCPVGQDLRSGPSPLPLPRGCSWVPSSGSTDQLLPSSSAHSLSHQSGFLDILGRGDLPGWVPGTHCSFSEEPSWSRFPGAWGEKHPPTPPNISSFEADGAQNTLLTFSEEFLKNLLSLSPYSLPFHILDVREALLRLLNWGLPWSSG